VATPRRVSEPRKRPTEVGPFTVAFAFYLTRLHTKSVDAPPVDEAGLVQTSSLAVIDLMGRFCSCPIQFGKVLASTRQTKAFSFSPTV
jgi:hypothetical protein